MTNKVDISGSTVQPALRLLLSDKEVAHVFAVAPSTVRAQRCHRNHGRDHWLTLDAVKLNSACRYHVHEVMELVGQLQRAVPKVPA
jgi:hypothetical protein